MKTLRGLLAFGCTLVVLGAAVGQLPLFSAAERLPAALAGLPPRAVPLLEMFTSSLGTPRPLGRLGGLHLDRLVADERSRRLAGQLAARTGLDQAVAWAFLAATSRGVTDEKGAFWPDLAGRAEATGGGESRAAVALRLLGKMRRQTGSLSAALLAWQVGEERAAHLGRRLAGDGWPEVLRRRLPEPVKLDAGRWLCTVGTLSRVYRAGWPTGRPSQTVSASGLVLAGGKGDRVVAPLAGRVSRDGRCLVVDHGCGLRSRLCGVTGSQSAPERPVAAGAVLGRAGGKATWSLWLGARRVSPGLLFKPAPAVPSSPPR